MADEKRITDSDMERLSLSELRNYEKEAIKRLPALGSLMEREFADPLEALSMTGALEEVIATSVIDSIAAAQDGGDNPNVDQLEHGGRVEAYCTSFSAERRSLADIEGENRVPGLHITIGGSKFEAEVRKAFVNNETGRVEQKVVAKAKPVTFSEEERQMDMGEFVNHIVELVKNLQAVDDEDFNLRELRTLSISLGQPQTDVENQYGIGAKLGPNLNKFWEIDNSEGVDVGKLVIEALNDQLDLNLEALVVGNDTYYPGEDYQAIDETIDELAEAILEQSIRRDEISDELSDEAREERLAEIREQIIELGIRGVTGEGANMMMAIELFEREARLLNLEVGAWRYPGLDTDPILDEAEKMGLLDSDEPRKLENLFSGGFVMREFAASLSLLNSDGDYLSDEYINAFATLARENPTATKIMDLLIENRTDKFQTELAELIDSEVYIKPKEFKRMRAVANLVMKRAAEVQGIQIAGVIRGKAEVYRRLMSETYGDANVAKSNFYGNILYRMMAAKWGVWPHTGNFFWKAKVVDDRAGNQRIFSLGEAATLKAMRILKRFTPAMNINISPAPAEEAPGGYAAGLQLFQDKSQSRA